MQGVGLGVILYSFLPIKTNSDVFKNSILSVYVFNEPPVLNLMDLYMQTRYGGAGLLSMN